MISQRFTQISARRVFAQRSISLTSTRFSAPALITACKPLTQSRPAATQTVPEDEAYSILKAQRAVRPVSPHLTIYQTQIPWTLSALNRITGIILSGGFYVFGAAYLVSPLLGWHLESSALAASFAELPTAVKLLLKFGVALPFTYHSWNGMRHLVWDSGRQFSNKMVVRSGQVVIGLTVVSSGALAVYGL
ncbi:cytochrome b subunit of succinate dehydrogenase, Sdh3p [Xanthoria parietina]